MTKDGDRAGDRYIIFILRDRRSERGSKGYGWDGGMGRAGLGTGLNGG